MIRDTSPLAAARRAVRRVYSRHFPDIGSAAWCRAFRAAWRVFPADFTEEQRVRWGIFLADEEKTRALNRAAGARGTT